MTWGRPHRQRHTTQQLTPRHLFTHGYTQTHKHVTKHIVLFLTSTTFRLLTICFFVKLIEVDVDFVHSVCTLRLNSRIYQTANVSLHCVLMFSTLIHSYRTNKTTALAVIPPSVHQFFSSTNSVILLHSLCGYFWFWMTSISPTFHPALFLEVA